MELELVKVFDKDGDHQLRFKADRKDQIQEWLGDIKYEDAVVYAQEVDCPVFGKALEFPCMVIERVNY